jgi:hypothetical protein
MPDLRFALRHGWILQEVTLCCCVSSCWCYEGLECLFLGTSIATKGTLGLPDSEDESNTILWKVLIWWQNFPKPKNFEYSVKCDLQLFSRFSVYSCVMNGLEIAYNCFLTNYKACIWGFVFSGMLKWRQVWEWDPSHSEAAHWLHPERSVWQKKPLLEYEVSVFLKKKFMNQNVVSLPKRQ